MTASDAIRKMLRSIDELKREWEHNWEEIERAILTRIDTTQIMIEKSHIERDLELLYKEIEHRRVNASLNSEQIQRSLTSFHDITENLNVNF